MNIIELAIEKITNLSKKQRLSPEGSREIRELIEELNQHLVQGVRTQNMILQGLSLQDKKAYELVSIGIEEALKQQAAETKLINDISQAVNLEVLAQILEQYPYELKQNKQAIIAEIRRIAEDKESDKIYEIFKKKHGADFEDDTIPFDYGIRDAVVMLASAQYMRPIPLKLPPKVLTQVERRKIPKKKLPELPKVKKAPSLSKTKADFTTPHPKISPEKDMVMGSSGREASLVSLATYKKLRQLQIAEITKQGERPKNRIFTPQTHPKLGLKYPVFLGANGEMIAIMISHMVGEGGMGQVFLGKNIDTGKIVAVKIQNPSEKYPALAKEQVKTKADERKRIEAIEMQERVKGNIRSEIKAMNEFGRLVSSIENGEELIIVDELAGSQNYAQILDEGLRLDVSEEGKIQKLELGLQFLEQAALVHEEGYLHRDLKVENIMWDNKTKIAKIIDLGLATPKPVPPKEFINGPKGMGSPIYMSPEVLDGRFSEGSDVYACGVALIELLAKNDIFGTEPSWTEYRKRYQTTRDEKVFMEFFQKAAPELFGNNPDPELRPIIEIIKKMIGPEDYRPSLSTAMAVVKEQKELLEMNLFVKNLEDRGQPLVTTINIKNPYIKAYIFEKCKRNDSRILDRIDPPALYSLLREAARTDNKAVFDNIVKRVAIRDQKGVLHGLFEQRNIGFSEDILRLIRENQKKKKSHTLLGPYEKALSEAKATWKPTQKPVRPLPIISGAVMTKLGRPLPTPPVAQITKAVRPTPTPTAAQITKAVRPLPTPAVAQITKPVRPLPTTPSTVTKQTSKLPPTSPVSSVTTKSTRENFLPKEAFLSAKSKKEFKQELEKKLSFKVQDKPKGRPPAAR